MKITIESTEKMVEIANGGDTVPARVWDGKTDAGVPVIAFITRISPRIPLNDPRQQDFQRELKETRAPSADTQAIPLRMIL